jgi:spore coat protein U-like protein
MSDTIISATFAFGSTPATAKVQSTAIKIGAIDVKISSNKSVNVLYNALASAFSSSIRRKLQKELEGTVENFLEDNGESLLDEFEP